LLSKKGYAGGIARKLHENMEWDMAAMGLLNPMFAAGAMAFSSVSVVTNSIRLRRVRL
jgi:hypothetical protein